MVNRLVETIPEIVKIVEVVSIIDELGSDYEYRSSEEDSSDEDWPIQNIWCASHKFFFL